MMPHAVSLAVPAPGLYPETPLVWPVPDGDWRMVVASPIVQVCLDGLILACAAGFGTDGTSIPEVLPVAKKGPWSTASHIHDCTFCTAAGWRATTSGALMRVHVTRDQADEAWRQGHFVKRHTRAAGPAVTAAHHCCLHMASWRAWRRYERDRKGKHAAEVAAIVERCEVAVWRLLTEGVSAVEGPEGFALAGSPVRLVSPSGCQ